MGKDKSLSLHTWAGRLWLVLVFLLWTQAGIASSRIMQFEIDGPIGPAASDYLGRGLNKAAEQGAALVILRLDTPGGLDSSMREIVQAVVASRVPVVVYVAPSGARAASAGTYILYASHVAAMAPATTLGAATPVQLPTPMTPSRPAGTDGKPAGEDRMDTMGRKVLNDAIAYIRGLAQMRGRNAEWAEQAVREAASLTAAEAHAAGVIEIIAADVEDLLAQLHGRALNVLGQELRLDTVQADLEILTPDWRSQLLAIISNPNIAYLLMMIGIYGLIYEFANPGMIFPGVAGAISLLLALYAFQALPINYAGLALMLLGIAFMFAEVFVPSFGALGIGGVVAFVIGSIILMESDVPGYGIALPVIFGVAAVSAAFFIAVMSMWLKSRQRPVVSGEEEMIGSLGEVLDAGAGTGHIRVHGEVWNARSSAPLVRGQRVRVVGIDGLTLRVEPLENGREEEKR